MCIVKDNTFNEEVRRKEDGISSHSETLVTEKQGMSKSRKPPNNNSHDNSRGRSASRKGIKCFRCGELGHMKNCARSLKRTIRKRKKRRREERRRRIANNEHIRTHWEKRVKWSWSLSTPKASPRGEAFLTLID